MAHVIIPGKAPKEMHHESLSYEGISLFLSIDVRLTCLLLYIESPISIKKRSHTIQSALVEGRIAVI